jgi:hypothetical protein
MTDAAMDKSSRPTATIEIRLGKLQQLFNSLDPSPFHDWPALERSSIRSVHFWRV